MAVQCMCIHSVHTHSHTCAIHCTPWWSVITVGPSIRIQPVFSPPLPHSPASSHSLFNLKITKWHEFCYRDCSFGVGRSDKAMRRGRKDEKNGGQFMHLVCVSLAGLNGLFPFFFPTLFWRFMWSSFMATSPLSLSFCPLLHLSHFLVVPSLYSLSNAMSLFT